MRPMFFLSPAGKAAMEEARLKAIRVYGAQVGHSQVLDHALWRCIMIGFRLGAVARNWSLQPMPADEAAETFDFSPTARWDQEPQSFEKGVDHVENQDHAAPGGQSNPRADT